MTSKLDKQFDKKSKAVLDTLNTVRLEANKNGVTLDNILTIITTAMKSIDNMKAPGAKKKAEVVNIVLLVILELGKEESVKALSPEDIERMIEDLYTAREIVRKGCFSSCCRK